MDKLLSILTEVTGRNKNSGELKRRTEEQKARQEGRHQHQRGQTQEGVTELSDRLTIYIHLELGEINRGEDGSQKLWGSIKKQGARPMGVKKDTRTPTAYHPFLSVLTFYDV